MATVQEAVRRLTIESRSVGVKEAAKDARELGAAVDGVAVASQHAEKATQSMEGRLASIQRKYDAQFRAQQEMARLERDLMRAQQQGLIDMNRRVELLSLAAERHGLASAAIAREAAVTEQLTAATQRLNAANDNASWRRRGLMYQGVDVVQMLALGQNPAMTAMQQGPQIAQLYAGQGGVNAALKDTMGLLAGVARGFGPIAVAAGVAGLAIMGIKSDMEAVTGQALTMGDVILGGFDAIIAGLRSIGGAFVSFVQPALDWIAPAFEQVWRNVQAGTAAFVNWQVRTFLIAFETIKQGVAALPSAFVAAGQGAANGFVAATEWLVRKVLGGLQVVIDGVNDFINQFGGDALRDALGWNLAVPDLMKPEDFSLGRFDFAAASIEDLEKRAARYQMTLAEIDRTDYANRAMDAWTGAVSDRAKARIDELTDAAARNGEAARAAADAWEGMRKVDPAYEAQLKAAQEAREAWQNVGNVIASMFDKPLQAGETFFDRMLAQAGQLGQALQKAVGGQAGGMIGAGLGGLSSGYGAQNPIMGGISGAVSGFATAGPWGALIGGVAGLIGGIFGAAKKAREEAAKTAKAMDDLNLRMLAVSTATDTLEGALTVFDAQARVEVARLREARAAADLILKTEQALALDRLAITRDFAARERDAARDALQQAYDREVGALRDLASAHRTFADSLIQFQNSLRLDTGLTSLNPRERLSEAERQYRELDRLAAGGDQVAMGRLTDAARNWLDEAMSYYAATTDYFAIFDEVNARIGDLATGSLQQATVADRQLAALEAQYAPLLGIQQGIQSLAAAAAAYHAADYSWQNAQYAVQQQQVAALNALAANQNVQQRMPSLLERMMDTGSSQSLWDRIFNWAPGFATGGDFTVRGSGGTDSVPVMFRATPGERVSIRTPSQAASGTNDTGELRNIARVSADGTQAIVETLVREVGALRAEIAEARRETREAAEDRRLSTWRGAA